MPTYRSSRNGLPGDGSTLTACLLQATVIIQVLTYLIRFRLYA
jgi:hypothetical protein